MFKLGMEALTESYYTYEHTFTINRQYYNISDLEKFIKAKKLAVTKLELTDEFLDSLNLIYAWGEPSTRTDIKVPMRVITVKDFLHHMDRIQTVKLDKPIIIRDILKSTYPDVLDGYHRIIKAALNKVPSLACYHLTIKEVLEFLEEYEPVK